MNSEPSNRNILKQKKALNVRKGMTATASVFTGLGVTSLGISIASFALNYSYKQDYNTALTNYKGASTKEDLNRYWRDISLNSKNANAFYYSAFATLSVSLAFLVPSIILYAAQPYDIRYRKKLEYYKNKVNYLPELNMNNENVTISLKIEY